MRVWLDPDKLSSRNLTASDVISVLREQNVQVAAGQIGQPPVPTGLDFQYTMSDPGPAAEPEQFGNIVVKTGSDGEVTYLRDVSRVELGAADQDTTLPAGRQALGRPGGLSTADGSNALETAERVRGQDARAGEALPATS